MPASICLPQPRQCGSLEMPLIVPGEQVAFHCMALQWFVYAGVDWGRVLLLSVVPTKWEE